MANASEQSLSQVGSVVFKNTVENLLLSIEEKAEKDPKTAEISTFEEIIALSDVLGEVVERALDLVDNTPIKLLRSQHSGRELFEIQGFKSIYRFFPNLPYCCCQSFHNQVVQGEEYCCKHYIAARIARALRKVEIVEVEHLAFRAIIKQIRF